MNCEIKYVGKYRNGKEKYWCLTHKAKASDKEGNKLKECLSLEKELFKSGIRMDPLEIKSMKIIFPNLLESKEYQIFINEEQISGVLYIENSVLEPQNFIGLLLAKLNDMELSEAICSHCHHHHNDNDLFAITPHRKHLCHYCGHEFFCKEANIGNEIFSYFQIPEIRVKEVEIKIPEKLCFTYDILNGKILINDIEVGYVLKDKEKLEVRKWVTQILK